MLIWISKQITQRRWHFTRNFICLLFLLTTHIKLSPAETSSLVEGDVVAGLNPLSFGVNASGYLRQIYHHSDSSVWDGLYLQAGAQTLLTPAFARLGVHVEWLPISPLQLRLQYDRLRFSGDFGSLLGFSSADEPYSDRTLEDRAGEERFDFGSHSLAQATLRVPVGRFLILNRSSYHHYRFPDDSPFYLEREHEILLAAQDRLVNNRLTLLYKINASEDTNQHFIGPFHDHLKGERSELQQLRAGLLWYKEKPSNIEALDKTRMFVQLGYYLEDRNREGQLTLQLGFGADLSL